MKACDCKGPWYHGSPEELTVLRAGSWVTPFKELAKAFSHKPGTISFGESVTSVKHNGKVPGFLYVVSEPVEPDAVTYLRDTAQTHWQTGRDLRLRLVARLPVNDPPLLSEEETAEVRKRNPEGATGFFGTPDED